MSSSFFDRLRTTPTRYYIYWSTALLTNAAGVGDVPPRSAIPEPFDLSNHRGNVVPSLYIGAVAGHIAVRSVERWLPNASTRVIRCAILAGATAVGTTVNSLVEFKFGHKLMGDQVLDVMFPDTTGDPLDMAYGTAVSGAASFAISSEQPHQMHPQIPQPGTETHSSLSPVS